MTAEAVAGWRAPDQGQPAHWVDVQGRLACDPAAEPVATDDLSPYRAAGVPCPGCAKVVDALRAEAERHGFTLTPRYRYPASG